MSRRVRGRGRGVGGGTVRICVGIFLIRHWTPGGVALIVFFSAFVDLNVSGIYFREVLNGGTLYKSDKIASGESFTNVRKVAPLENP